MVRKIILGFAIISVMVAGVGAYMWYKPHPKAENAKGIKIEASAIAKEYTTDEKSADVRYLNKAIEVTGVVAELQKNQDGGLMVILQTEDPAAGVQCTLRDRNTNPQKGQKITLKGFCSGNGIMGISLTDCIVIN